MGVIDLVQSESDPNFYISSSKDGIIRVWSWRDRKLRGILMFDYSNFFKKNEKFNANFMSKLEGPGKLAKKAAETSGLSAGGAARAGAAALTASATSVPTPSSTPLLFSSNLTSVFSQNSDFSDKAQTATINPTKTQDKSIACLNFDTSGFKLAVGYTCCLLSIYKFDSLIHKIHQTDPTADAKTKNLTCSPVLIIKLSKIPSKILFKYNSSSLIYVYHAEDCSVHLFDLLQSGVRIGFWKLGNPILDWQAVPDYESPLILSKNGLVLFSDLSSVIEVLSLGSESGEILNGQLLKPKNRQANQTEVPSFSQLTRHQITIIRKSGAVEILKFKISKNFQKLLKNSEHGHKSNNSSVSNIEKNFGGLDLNLLFNLQQRSLLDKQNKHQITYKKSSSGMILPRLFMKNNSGFIVCNSNGAILYLEEI